MLRRFTCDAEDLSPGPVRRAADNSKRASLWRPVSPCTIGCRDIEADQRRVPAMVVEPEQAVVDENLMPLPTAMH